MKNQAPSLFRTKFALWAMVIRRFYFKKLGLQIKRGGYLGKITCDWPGNLFIGANCTVLDRVDFHITHPFSDKNIISIGDRVFIGRSCTFNSTSKISVGSDTYIGELSILVDVNHERKKGANINTQPAVSKDIIIGENVCIGERCIILPGVAIGNGSVIAPGSNVTKSIPENQVWGGNPARFVENKN